jgi:response regulator RpfG family c-di-GMP phosphodiesterase
MQHTVLFVDDEQSILDAIRRTLKTEPYTLLVAPSGPVALGLIEEHDVSIIVSDLRMPIMDGIQFLRRARKLRPRAIRIILSANAERESVISAALTGDVWRYLIKPWDEQHLLDTLRAAGEEYEKAGPAPTT